MRIHVFYMTAMLIIIGLAIFALDTQERTITELQNKLECTKVELYNLNQQIAEGLCLPQLEGFTK